MPSIAGSTGRGAACGGPARRSPGLRCSGRCLCRDGVVQMQADAELAAATMSVGSFWQTAATLYLGMAHLMAADPGQG